MKIYLLFTVVFVLIFVKYVNCQHIMNAELNKYTIQYKKETNIDTNKHESSENIFGLRIDYSYNKHFHERLKLKGYILTGLYLNLRTLTYKFVALELRTGMFLPADESMEIDLNLLLYEYLYKKYIYLTNGVNFYKKLAYKTDNPIYPQFVIGIGGHIFERISIDLSHYTGTENWSFKIGLNYYF
jgi:hypothetical protein